MDLVLNLEHEERDFIAACIRKEKWAQKILYEEFYGVMMGICLRYAGNEGEALDILHEGFIKVFKNIGKYNPGTSLSAWIRRIMINTCIDFYRKKTRRRTDTIDEASQIKAKGPDAVSMVSEKEILAAIHQLSPAYRTVFNMYVIEGYSHKEISERLHISESTSRSNLVKARSKLRVLMNINKPNR